MRGLPTHYRAAFRILQGAAAACISGTPETDGVVFEWKVGVATAPRLPDLLLAFPLVEASLPNSGSRLGRQACGVVGAGKRTREMTGLPWSLEGPRHSPPNWPDAHEGVVCADAHGPPCRPVDCIDLAASSTRKRRRDGPGANDGGAFSAQQATACNIGRPPPERAYSGLRNISGRPRQSDIKAPRSLAPYLASFSLGFGSRCPQDPPQSPVGCAGDRCHTVLKRKHRTRLARRPSQGGRELRRYMHA